MIKSKYAFDAFHREPAVGARRRKQDAEWAYEGKPNEVGKTDLRDVSSAGVSECTRKAGA